MEYHVFSTDFSIVVTSDFAKKKMSLQKMNITSHLQLRKQLQRVAVKNNDNFSLTSSKKWVDSWFSTYITSQFVG